MTSWSAGFHISCVERRSICLFAEQGPMLPRFYLFVYRWETHESLLDGVLDGAPSGRNRCRCNGMAWMHCYFLKTNNYRCA